MATNECADCGGTVSTEAKACPHCGRETGKGCGYQLFGIRGGLGTFFVIFVLFAVFVCAYQESGGLY